MPLIRRLRPDDADAVLALRRASLIDAPLAFGSAPGDDRLSPHDFVRELLGDAGAREMFGALAPAPRGGADLVGMVGLLRGARKKQAHRADIVSMFVTPAARGQGVGRSLMEAAIARARAWGVIDLHLAVSEAAPAAQRLYEGLGFTAWGTEPRALGWEGRLVDEHHMVLPLVGG